MHSREGEARTSSAAGRLARLGGFLFLVAVVPLAVPACGQKKDEKNRTAERGAAATETTDGRRSETTTKEEKKSEVKEARDGSGTDLPQNPGDASDVLAF